MASELWDLYDMGGHKTGRTMTRGEEVPAGMYHQVVHIWPVNLKGEFLIQQRSPFVQWKPGCWATTGGAAISGEKPIDAARRELREELGYDADVSELRQIACLRRSSSFCNVFIISLDLPKEAFILQKEEVSAVRWCRPAQMMRMIADNTLYNYGDSYYRMIFQYQQGTRRAIHP